MATGKTHDYIGLGLGITASLAILVNDVNVKCIFFFSTAWLFATFIFSPDTDVMPKKRVMILRFLLFPYSIIFKHRGLSHGILTGTITRIVYLILMFALIIFITNKMGYLKFDVDNYFNYIVSYLQNFNINHPSYRYPLWFLMGHFGADLSHIFLDRLSSFFKRIF